MSVRVTDGYLSRLLVRSMQRNLGQMLRYQQMNSTMQRLLSYADDPRGVGAIQRYDTLLAINGQYTKNIERASTFIDATDIALQDIAELLRDARDIAMRESSASGTVASNAQSADEVQSLIRQLMNTLNANVEGNFIFGGFRTDLTPFIEVNGDVQYQGDSGEISTQVGPHTEVVVNVPGSAFLGAATALLRGSADVAPPLTGATPLASLNLGRGWQAGTIAVTDGNGQNFAIDLTGAADIAAVIAAVAAQSGGQLTAAIAPSGHGLQISGVGPLTVAEVDRGTTAQSLGLLGSAVGGLLVGTDIRPAPTAATPLADIPSLSGALPLGSLIISGGGASATVDLSGAATIGDLAALINAAVPGMTLDFDDGVLSLVSASSQSFEVTNGPGSTAASDLGLQGTGTPARLFGVLQDLRDALEANDKPAMRALFAELSAVEELVLGLVVKVGGRQVVSEWMTSVLQQRDQQLELNRSRERDADVIETASELSRAQAAYQASLLAASRMFEVNLMHYLG